MPPLPPPDPLHADLRFSAAAATGADLRFGAGDAAGGGSVDASAEALLPALTLAAAARASVPAQVVAALPAMVVLGDAQYRSNTQRPTIGRADQHWQIARAQQAGAAALAHQIAVPAPAGRSAHWSRAAHALQAVLHRLPPVLQGRSIEHEAGFRSAIRAAAATRFSHQVGTRREIARWARFEAAGRMHRKTVFSHRDCNHQRRASLDQRWQRARSISQRLYTHFQSAAPAFTGRSSRFQAAVVPPPGISWLVVLPPEPPPCYTPALPAHLLFSAAAASGLPAQLLFICDRDDGGVPLPPITVPVRRVYIVLNTVTLRRADDNVEIPVESLSLSLDAASWAWGFEASLPASAESLVDPGAASGPVELLASVNGTAFRVLAENISRERIFGDASIRISGRGRNAILAAPYAPVMTFSNTEGRTARQLMDDVLTVNGVPLGWSVDWGLTDWNVPAGAFAHQGTWIEALAAIAGAAGGYLMPHRTARSLRVRHRYPVAPWEWGSVTPDFVLPVAAVARESLRWVEKPAYNRVFVSGQGVGVLGQVTRAGTAGDVLAPMVVDALITEAAAARQRGIAVLADTGRQVEVSLRLPVLAETGIIEPGAFVEYQDGSVTRLGLVRATQVQAGFPEVWQTLGVQAYA